MDNSNQKGKHGGHITGFRADVSKGRGPVFEIRRALNISQAELARKIGASESTLRGWERRGVWPVNRAFQSNLRGLAAESGIDLARWPLPDEGGVFL